MFGLFLFLLLVYNKNNTNDEGWKKENMGVRNVVPIHDIVKPDIFEDKIELISTCKMSIDELKSFALVLKYAAVVMEKDGITKENIKRVSVIFFRQ